MIALASAQVAVRAHVLEAVDAGIYRAKQPLEFKAGELIGLEKAPLDAAVLGIEGPLGDYPIDSADPGKKPEGPENSADPLASVAGAKRAEGKADKKPKSKPDADAEGKADKNNHSDGNTTETDEKHGADSTEYEQSGGEQSQQLDGENGGEI